MYTISKNFNIILLDEDLRKSEKKFQKFLKKRCYILKSYSKNNYTNFNEKSLLNNKYNYKDVDEQGLRNQSFYMVKHKELEVIDLTKK